MVEVPGMKRLIALLSALPIVACAQVELPFDMNHRMRAVVQGPDGAIWMLEDDVDGRLLKITPAI